MFTAESTVNVAVSSATVKVSATASNVSVSSTLGTLGSVQASFDSEGTLNIANMVPGDVVTFKIGVVNESTVAVKYNAVLKAVGDNAQLFSYLDFKINGHAYNGETLDEGWKLLSPDVEDLGTITVDISLPENVGNDAQGLSCSIAYIVQAIQSNVSDADIPQYFPAN
jgi:hypothetical protein